MRVQAQKLCMQYNDAGRVIEVFRDLDLDIASGTSIAIVGESGVGKTTLLYILGGLEQAVSGEVVLGDASLTEMVRKKKDAAAFRGRNIGFVFQFHQLLAEFDAVENVAMPLLIAGKSQGESRKRATELLERVGLGHRLSHRPGALSGGEQQRVAIARALAGRPGIILADEPTGNLDYRTGDEITKLLLELHREEGTTLVVATHSLELARKMNQVLELTPTGMREFSGELQ